MLRKIVSLLVACLLLAVLVVPVAAASNHTPLKSFEHELQAGQIVVLKKYIGASKNVVIPAQYKINDSIYSVRLDAKTIFRGNETIETVDLKPDVGFVNNTMITLFAECPNLRSVVAANINTSGVTSLEYLCCNSKKLQSIDVSGWNTESVVSLRSAFSGCEALTQLKGYTTWNTSSVEEMQFLFNYVGKLEKVDLRKWDLSNLKNSGWCFQACGAKKILLPDNIAVISAGFVNHAAQINESSFVIPSGVKTIGYAHTFYDFATNDFKEFVIAEGNTQYKTIDGILYSADGQKMLAIPRGKTFPDDTYEIPEGVTFLGELSFSRNYNVEKVILPNSYLLEDVPIYDPDYIIYNDIGNLNSGLNLHIAIYMFTGVEEYEVRADNPNYQSVDGVLYSKDMTTLLAVPTRYRGRMEIPEGVQVWRSGAMWYGSESINEKMENTNLVSIPASMSDIAQDQLVKLNWLEENVEGFRIKVHKDNPVYYVNGKGQLAKRTDIAQLEVCLDSQVQIYDGTEKTPKVTIRYGEQLLQPDRDYTVEYMNNIQAGTAIVRITASALFYGIVERTFTIEKAVPEYTAPQELQAEYGQLLRDVPLPEGFFWEKPLYSVGDAGQNQWNLNYTNGDVNYQTVTEIAVTVHVEPKEICLSPSSDPMWELWTGKALTPAVKLYDGKTIIPATEYTLIYEDNVGFGYGKVTVADNPGGNYTVSGTEHFLIVPGPLMIFLPLLALLTILAICQDTRRKRNARSAKPLQNP